MVGEKKGQQRNIIAEQTSNQSESLDGTFVCGGGESEWKSAFSV